MLNHRKDPFFSKKSFRSQSGQVAVIVFLIMAVLLVVGLSLATRTSQEIEQAGQQEDTTRVFNAAESGIEEALSDTNNFETGTSFDIDDASTQTSGTVTITPSTNLENVFESGETATVYLKNAVQTPVSINWSKSSGDAECSVLVVSAYIQSGSNYSAEHYGIAPPSGLCTSNTAVSDTNFTRTSYTPDSGYRYKYVFTPPTNTKLLRITPLLAATTLSVSGTNLDSQQHTITSSAQDTSSGNTEVRTIEVTRTKPAPPQILDYALYSGETIVKNN